jgi:hypothetical protein
VSGETVILEIKSITHILPVHDAQRLSHCAVELLLNFNTNLLQDSLRRFVNTPSPRTPGTPRPP